jgi:hypothetical protein
LIDLEKGIEHERNKVEEQRRNTLSLQARRELKEVESQNDSAKLDVGCDTASVSPALTFTFSNSDGNCITLAISSSGSCRWAKRCSSGHRPNLIHSNKSTYRVRSSIDANHAH